LLHRVGTGLERREKPDLKADFALSNNKWIHVSTCMLALLICVLVACPFVSLGINDDWSYFWTARTLASTGHLTYNGWGAMMLGWQAYLGALFIKLFGFSFTAVRSSILMVSLLCTALMQRIFVRLGISESTASIATLMLVLSPLFLPLAFSFMSDIPGLFVLVLCIYYCLRAIQSLSDSAALGWLICAALSNIIGGTVRQIAWLGVLVVVPSAAWSMRRRPHMLSVGAASVALGALSIALCLHWFRLQPYAIREPFFLKYHFYMTFSVGSLGIEALLFLLPVMSAFVVTCPAGKRPARNIGAILGGVVAMVFFWWAVTTQRNYFGMFKEIPFGISGGGNFVMLNGFPSDILGRYPQVVPIWARLLLTVFTFAAFSSTCVCLMGKRTTARSVDTDNRLYPKVNDTSLFTLLAPFTVAYVLLIATRITIFDRYFLPLLFVLTIGLLRFYTRVISNRLPKICLIVTFLYAVYGVANMHDMFAFERARVDAVHAITSTGIPRTEIEGGEEYDAWTQLEQTGYVNDPRIEYPSNAYRSRPVPNVPPECKGWFRDYVPSIHPVFYISQVSGNCYHPSRFAPVVYQTWLPPRQRRIYILESH
jgi:hypothetical protein